jgi:CDP-paratose 2-epimerase
VLAGAGQFGRADQGIFAYWINAWLRRRPLKYLGFGGAGHQVRDCLHPRDLVAGPGESNSSRAAPRRRPHRQLRRRRRVRDLAAPAQRLVRRRLGPHEVAADPTPRPFDIPWMVLDAMRRPPASGTGNPPPRSAPSWRKSPPTPAQHPDWLDRSAPL